jgi:hypothetical protein
MTSSRRALLGLTAGLAAGALLPSPAAHAEPFLTSTGGKGPLAAEEQKLYNLRVEMEGEARREIEAERVKLESEARMSQVGKLCATPYGIDIVGITEFVALVGALVGGITARQRKAELERLNEQLRKINMSLRQQARAGTVYAPGEGVGGGGGGLVMSGAAAWDLLSRCAMLCHAVLCMLYRVRTSSLAMLRYAVLRRAGVEVT